MPNPAGVAADQQAVSRPRTVFGIAAYLAAVTASLYYGHEHGEIGFSLIPLEFLAAVGAGFAIGRWWALALAFVVVPVLVVAPFAGETDSDGATLRSLALLVGPLLSLWPLLGLILGVGARKVSARRREATH